MKKSTALIVGLLAWTVVADPFWDWYGDKGAEISSYKTTQPRYGEKRDAYTVMIFVPEHTNRSSRIKVENYGKTKKKDRIQVLKLNRVLHFDTGIYNYAVMTSTFSAMQPEFGRRVFYPVKISISSTEWCGNFYEHLLPDGKGSKHVMHSYFEKEGDQEGYIKSPGNDIYEDNLPILIRELKGPFLKTGEKREINLLPSLWCRRITHEPLKYHKSWVKKEQGKTIRVAGEAHKTSKWSWQGCDRVETYWTSTEYPHVILRWKSTLGHSGELVKTIRSKYWSQNKNVDVELRKALGIPATASK